MDSAPHPIPQRAFRRTGLPSALLVLAGTWACETAPPDHRSGEWYVAPTLAWAPCQYGDASDSEGMECTTLSVPVNWADSTAPRIDLEVARLPATSGSDREGIVIVLSGGPGGSGIDDLAQVAAGLPEVRNRYDFVAHKPRTVIDPQTLPDACVRWHGAIVDFPADSVEYGQILTPIAAAVQRCRAQDEGGLIDHLDGLSQALDVEAIRRAMREERVNLTAQSYGGVVVASYARAFPERVRAAYIDGAASHPDYPFVRGPQTQLEQFEGFIAWCEGDARCPLFGEDVRGLWEDLTESANRSPIPATSERHGQRHMSGAQLHFLTRRWRNPGDDHANWINLASAISDARDGDASAFIDWAYGNLAGWSIPVTMAMQCPDGAEGLPGYQRFRARIDRYRSENPLLFGTKLLGLPCGAWPAPFANPPAPLPGERLPPFLGAGTIDNDLPGTQQLLEHIPGSAAIAVPGDGHVVYLGGATEAAVRCVFGHLSRYLLDLQLPPDGEACPE